VLSGNYIFTIRRPITIIQEAKTFFGYLTGIASVAVHDPDIISAAGI